MGEVLKLLFSPRRQIGMGITNDVFGRGERWVMLRPWAQRVCALWILSWVGLLGTLAVLEFITWAPRASRFIERFVDLQILNG